MAQKLLDALMLRSCSHEFSWPRRAADSQYYQVCLLCAVEYKYDWQTMKRIERVDRPQRTHHGQETKLGASRTPPEAGRRGPLSSEKSWNLV